MVDITRLTGGNTPANGGDPRTFPAIWNATATSLESALAEAPVTVSATAPASPVNGDLWWDTVNESLFMYYTGVDPAEWIVAGGGGGGASVTISSTAPADPTAGDMWWDSDNGNLYIYYDDGTSQQWVAGNGPQVFVGTTSPTGYQGQLWFDSTTGKVYIYYDDGTSAQWVSAIGGSLAGNVIQVVSTTKTDVFSTTSTSFTDITGLSASITPRSTSSKLLISYNLPLGISNRNASVHVVVTDGSDVVLIDGDASGSRPQVSTSQYFGDVVNLDRTFENTSLQFLHSPGTTSTFTVKLRMRLDTTVGGTAYVGRTGQDADSDRWARLPSTITVMEVAG
jgi:hypothetical protein